jgi:poly(ADP-ribose) glycohydrolase ARH3
MSRVSNIGVDRSCGALLGTFVGDALGMAFEGDPPAAIPLRLEMVEARLGRGTYTDDTEMMIVLAESLIEDGFVQPESLARRFLERHDPRRGYGGGTLRVFAHWRDGVPVDVAAGLVFGGQGSAGNGAAMRIAPVGVRFAADPARLLEQARRSAAVTHAHPLGIDGAVAQAAAVAAAVRGDDVAAAARQAVETDEMRRQLDTVAELLDEALADPTEVAEALGNGSTAPKSVPLAVYAACRTDDFREAVTFAVRCGGDTDTIAAMAGAIAGARHGRNAIPSSWLDVLEDGAYGRSYVERLAASLAAQATSG